ncbi:phage tail protein [Rhodocyclus purpureus]|uniref:phage tail protein n=1 Tax=Rhodocyclus purpureus TaxID=1067 RepID=UPI001912FB60|nr:phage tail protein [Rhodocyclus purpureus]
MVKINVRHNLKEQASALRKVAVGLRSVAINEAINKTASKARSDMVKKITDEFNIDKSEARSQLKVSRAKDRSNLVAVIQAFPRRRGHRSRNVMLFNAEPAPGTATKRIAVLLGGRWVTLTVPVGGGVSVQIKRNGPRKIIKGAFIGNKGRTVFERTGDGRKIKAVETVDVPSMFNTKRINGFVVKRIQENFPKELRKAIAKRLAM